MGNVAGIGQFLETVGVPGPQAGVQAGLDGGVPGQDFATAMQQAGGPVAKPAVSGQQEEEVGDLGRAARGGSVKAADSGKSESPQSGTNGRRSVPGESLGSTRAVSVGGGIVAGAEAAAPAVTAQGAVAGTRLVAESASLTTRDSSPELSAGTVAAKMPGTLSLPGTQGLQIASNAAAENATAAAEARAVVGSAVAAAGPFHGAGAAAAANKPGQEDGSGNTKSTEKAGASAAKDSKLTALMPQGTGVAMPDAGLVLPAVTPFATVPATVPDGGNAANSKTMPLEGNESGKPVSAAVADGPSAGAAAAIALRDAVEPTASLKQADNSAGDATGLAALVGTRRTSSADVPVSVNTTMGQGESAASWTRVIQGSAEQALQPVAASSSVGMAVPVPTSGAAGAMEGQRAGTNGAVPDQAIEASRAVPLTDRPTPAAASKTGLEGGRGAVAMAAAGGPASATSASSIKASAEASVAGLIAGSVAPKGANSAAANTPAAALPVAAAPAAHPAAVGTAKDAAMAAVQRVQGPGTPPVKTAAAADGDASVPAAKVASEMGTTSATAQPALAAAEPMAGLAPVAPVSVLVAHETVSGTMGTVGAPGAAAAISGAPGMGAGTQELGAGLSHTTLSATPTSLEVGVSGGTHGWLKIRAELNATGEVNASLSGATPAATERLRGELPAMNNYLQGERVAMGALDVRPALHTVIAAGESSATFSQTGSGQGSASQGGTNQSGSGQAHPGGAAMNTNAGSADAGSSGGQRQQQDAPTVSALSGVNGVDEVVPGRASDAAFSGDSIELGDSAGASSVGYGIGGGRLNVRA